MLRLPGISRKVKILQLTNRLPYPAHDGGAIAMLAMTRSFHKLGHEVTLLCLNTKKHYFPPEKLPEEIKDLARIIAVDIDTSIQPAAAFLNLFTQKSYNIERFRSADFERQLIGLLQREKFDIIQLEGLHIALYLPVIQKYSKAIVSLRAHNLEYIIWERLANGSKGPKAWYLNLLARRMKRFELKAMNEADSLIPITEHDATLFRQLGCSKPIHVCPTGIDLESYQPADSIPVPHSIFHLGALDWLPNQEALRWFLLKVWPDVKLDFPNLTFSIAGRHFPDWVKNLSGNGIEIVGAVDDAQAFMRQKGIMVVPLQSGSGMRIKIIEGMALGKAIVSTSIGAEGILCTDGQNIMIADTPVNFYWAIGTLLSNPDMAMKIGNQARLLIENQYTNTKLVGSLICFYQSLLAMPKKN